MLSHWEKETWYDHIDYLIVGSGIVGLSTAIWLKRQAPDSKILIVERGKLPHGASTKNAGFLCFGSIGELQNDLESSGEDTMLETLSMRIEGLTELDNLINLTKVDYQSCGGTELFANEKEFINAKSKISYFNELIDTHFGYSNCFQSEEDQHPFSLHNRAIINQHEGRLDTGLMISRLFQLAISEGILYLPSTEVQSWENSSEGFSVICQEAIINTKQIILCTNAFTSMLHPSANITPYRSQVILTSRLKTAIPDTCYHYEQGYIYFRPIGDRLLIGGGRNRFGTDEQTNTIANSEKVINFLVNFVNEILPKEDVSAQLQWSGILAIGDEKKPLIEKIGPSIYLGARLGGMGVAIGSKVGKDLAHLVLKDNGYI